MSKLIELQSQIEKLQKQASEIRSKEFASTVIEIQKLMTAYGITVKDLLNSKEKNKGKRGRPAKDIIGKVVKVKKEKTTVAAKYQGPNGESWSGRGLTPKWLSTLIAAGQAKETFLIAEKTP
jgi:DNA-binding protein H-NS